MESAPGRNSQKLLGQCKKKGTEPFPLPRPPLCPSTLLTAHCRSAAYWRPRYCQFPKTTYRHTTPVRTAHRIPVTLSGSPLLSLIQKLSVPHLLLLTAEAWWKHIANLPDISTTFSGYQSSKMMLLSGTSETRCLDFSGQGKKVLNLVTKYTNVLAYLLVQVTISHLWDISSLTGGG